jgi:dTDP-4-dehydrorhamnose 3,5-epimerase
MKIIEDVLNGVKLIKPNVFYDTRGYFFESFNKNAFAAINISTEFVQDNFSFSSKNVLRGLHFQNPPFAQAKLVSVLRGRVLDVAVDIRKNSATYGQHFICELSEENKLMLYIPEGFAHGFLTMENDTLFSYKCSNVYNKESESGIMWNDPDINIKWDIANPILSAKDETNTLFKNFKSLF